MTRFEKFAYATAIAALLVAWLGLQHGNSALQERAGAHEAVTAAADDSGGPR